MKVITLNINGIRAGQRKGFFEWFLKQDANILCLQEIKAQKEQLISKDFFPQDYYYYFKSAEKKGYSGVAIYSKEKALNVKENLGLEWADNEGRYLECEFKNYIIVSIYMPSGSSDFKTTKLRHKKKMEFLEFYKDILQKQKNSKKPIIICGDFNIVHKEIDIKNWKPNKDKASGVLEEERKWLDYIFNELNFKDSFREINKEPNNYTWWSNRGKARINNVGWRIDYQIFNYGLEVIKSSNNVYRETWFSDHAPLIMKYKFL